MTTHPGDPAVATTGGNDASDPEALEESFAGYDTHEDLKTVAQNPIEMAKAYQMAGVDALNSGYMFEAIDEFSFALDLAESDSTDCRLIASIWRDIGQAYTTLYSRRAMIEDVEDRDTVKSDSDDLQDLADEVYRRARACLFRSKVIFNDLKSASAENTGVYYELLAEVNLTQGFIELLEFRYSRTYGAMFFERVATCGAARASIRDIANHLGKLGYQPSESLHLNTTLRVVWGLERPFYLLVALLQLRSVRSEPRINIWMTLRSALGDRLALFFEMHKYPNERIIGVKLPHWDLD